MIKEQGLWVHTGKLPPGFDTVQAIRDDPEERIRKMAGLSRNGTAEPVAAAPPPIPTP